MSIKSDPWHFHRKMKNSFLLGLVVIVSFIKYSQSFSLTTTSVVKKAPSEVFNFIATPTNWPSIVASSHSVKRSSVGGNPVDVPLNVGDYVEEIFGLPPLLPLSVVWECVVAKESSGELQFYSKNGVPNFARNCSMKFKIAAADGASNSGTNVELVMGYEALNPLVFFATPLLNVDNALALKVLLPLAMEQ